MSSRNVSLLDFWPFSICFNATTGQINDDSTKDLFLNVESLSGLKGLLNGIEIILKNYVCKRIRLPYEYKWNKRYESRLGFELGRNEFGNVLSRNMELLIS